MKYIVLTHLSGSKANQIEEFPISDYQELIVGRDDLANVQFDDTETLVGRQHCKITQNPEDPTQFFITDLNSRNGTFLNRQRVVGTVELKPSDIVRCGPVGPEFRFDLEPGTERLKSGSAPTRRDLVRPLMKPATPATSLPLPNLGTPAPGPPPEPESEVPVSKEPVREEPVMHASAPLHEAPDVSMAEPEREKANRPLLIGGGILMGVFLLVAGIMGYRSLTAADAGETGKTVSTPQPNDATVAAKADNTPSKGVAGEADKDEQRAAWRIEVLPYLMLGSGGPGQTDFDKPDGLAFSPSGVLYATDASNRRVQIWDVKSGKHLGEFSHEVFGGQIADIAVSPNGTVYITDQTLNHAYAFLPPRPGEVDGTGKRLGPYDHQFKGTRFREQQFQKLGGIAIDSRGRVYIVDAQRNDVSRFNSDETLDQTFKFEQKRVDGDTYLHGSEGVAIDEAEGNLFVASEKDSLIQVFDLETGAYKHKLIGASLDGAEKPAGKHVFFGPVEGLTLARRHLLAVDEGAGHIQLFDLDQPDAFNSDLARYAAPQPNRPGGYRGFFGHGPPNPPGHFCSPDAIASYSDPASGEVYIAIADECNYRLVVFRWSDIARALGQPITLAAIPPPPLTTARPVAPRRSVVRRPPRRVVVVRPPVSRKDAAKAREKAEKEAKKRLKKQKEGKN